jgi:3-hydroxyisobutyrate dehydrogenase-like beta-hydroxyacid dehydrogenase
MEGLTMAEKNGADPMAVVEMLTTTLFPAPIYQTYGRAIAAKAIPAVSSPIGAKDLGLFIKTARQAGAPSPVASLMLDLQSS